MLLAFLVLEHLGPTDRRRIAELLWGDGELASGWEASVRRVISRLRAALRRSGLDDALQLTGASGCYRLERTAATVVDVEAAHAEVAGAAHLLGEGDPQGAAAATRRALGVLRRPLLAGAQGPWVEERRAELSALRLRALELEAQADIALGRSLDAVDAGTEAVALAPLSESAYRALMAAHQASGNRADALGVYERCRRALADELGVFPSRETEALYLSLLGDTRRAIPPGETAPAGDGTAEGPASSPPARGTADPTGVVDHAEGPGPRHPPGEHGLAAHGLAQALADARRSPLVGRRGELAAIGAAWSAALEGRPSLWLVEGEAGAGKTRLLAEAAHEAVQAGATALFGRCHQHADVPFAPLVEAVSALVAGGGGAEDGGVVGELAHDLGQMLPGLGSRLHPGAVGQPSRKEVGDPLARRAWMASGFSDLVTLLAGERPLVLLVDDLHWAEPSTIHLLSHLARSLREAGASVLTLASLRPELVPPGSPLASLLLEGGDDPSVAPSGVVRLSLSGLELSEVKELVEVRAGRGSGSAESLARSLYASTSGNPLFVVEMLEQLLRDGAGGGVPRRISELVGWRLGRLGDTARRVLTTAAVIGETFDVATLLAATLAGEAAVLEALEDGLAGRLLRSVGGSYDRLGFSHAVVRSAIYESLAPPLRRRVHRQVGLAIEEGPAPASRFPELAYHFGEAATVGERDRAASYARCAGDLARRQLAFDEAAAYYDAALAHLLAGDGDGAAADRRGVADLRLALGEALRLAGDARHRGVLRRAADDARALGDPLLLARVGLAWNGTGQATQVWDVDRELIDVLREAEAGLPPGHEDLRARLLSTLVAESLWEREPAETARLAEAAIEVAAVSGSPATLAEVLTRTYDGIAGPDRVAGRLGQALRLLELGKVLGDPAAICRGHVYAVDNLVEIAAPRVEIERHMAEAERLAERLGGGEGSLLWEVGIRRAGVTLLAGDLAGADELISRARASAASCSVPEVVADIVAQSQQAMRHAVDDNLGPLLDTARSWAAIRSQFSWRGVFAMALVEVGRDAEAVETVDAFGSEGFADRPRNLTWLADATVVGWACDRVGAWGLATELVGTLTPYRGRLPWLNGVPVPPVDLVLGLACSAIGDHRRALALLDAAEATCRRCGAGLWDREISRARTLIAARASGRGGDLVPAEATATDALPGG